MWKGVSSARAVPREVCRARRTTGRGKNRRALVLCAGLFGFLGFFLGCSDDSPAASGEADSVDSVQACPQDEAYCNEWALDLPRGTPDEECPSARKVEGICWPSPPEPPEWECPEGWTARAPPLEPLEIARIGTLIEIPLLCEPPAPPRCIPGWMPVAGSATCVQQGLSCPADGTWPSEDALRALAPSYEGTIRYVAAETSAGGTGSRVAPFADLTSALAAAQDGDILALSVGMHAGPVALERRLALVGACAGGTRVGVSSPQLGPAVAIDSPTGARVVQLDLIGPSGGLLIRRADAPVVVSAVTVATEVGPSVRVEISRARTVLQDVQILGGLSQGEGLQISRAAVDVERVTVLEATQAGVALVTAASLEGHDLLVADTRPGPDELSGSGVAVWDGTANLERVVLLRNRLAALYVTGSGSALRVVDAWVADTQLVRRATLAAGLLVQRGARADISRAVFLGHTQLTVGAYHSGTEVALADVFLGETQVNANGRHGDALYLASGAALSARRAVLWDHSEAAALAVEPGTVLELSDILVSASVTPSPLRAGAGVGCQLGATCRIGRALLHRSDLAGLAALTGATLEGTDLLVLDPQPHPDFGWTGFGLVVEDDAHLDLRRAALVGSSSVALAVGSGHAGGLPARANVVDLLVLDGMPADPVNALGRGILVSGATVEIERAVIVGSHQIGLGVITDQSQVDVRDLVIRDTRAVGVWAGVGLSVGLQGSLTARRFEITGSESIGIQVARDARMDAESGLVRLNMVGISADLLPEALARAFRQVIAVDNVLDRGLVDVPVPTMDQLVDGLFPIR
jgi:hypothetical protein